MGLPGVQRSDSAGHVEKYFNFPFIPSLPFFFFFTSAVFEQKPSHLYLILKAANPK